MELDLEETDLARLFGEIVEVARPAAENNGNKISGVITPDLGTALCDAGKFRNMVGQLLDNAAKFTHNGKIDFIAERRLDGPSDELVIHVVDTGIGIASDQISNLFEKFTVADDSSTSKYGGTGLGLALSQKLCKLMGGEIFVESEVGKGSRFTVRMPLLTGRRKGDAFASATLVPAAADSAHPSNAETANA